MVVVVVLVVFLDDSDRKGSGGGAILVIIIAVALIALAWLLSQLVRLALSRSRELLADAGSVELTKNPDAMISALRKIESRGELPGATSAVMELCLDNPREGFSDLFATHPSVDCRVQALVKYRRRTRSRAAGAAVGSDRRTSRTSAPTDGQVPPPLPSGPWGDRHGSRRRARKVPVRQPGPWGNPPVRGAATSYAVAPAPVRRVNDIGSD